MAQKAVAVREDIGLALNPKEVVENATVQAKLLMDIVNQTHCYQEISGKKYLQVEAWETIGAFNRVHAVPKEVKPIMRNDEVVGYQAEVQLLKDGIVVGGAIMPCFFSENACKGREGDAKHKASMSAAQTFATSKAYRMNYSYVATLAGYQPTPAEEMTDEASDDKPASKGAHWCELHQVRFFKKGKMKSWAHPIKETSPEEWCNEGEVDSGKTKGQVETEALPDEPQAPTSPIESEMSAITPTEIKTIQALYNWVAKHGKTFTRSWVLANIGMTGKEIQADPQKAYTELKALTGWID